MELLIIFVVISVLEKIFKTKKDQKNIQEARRKRMETLSPSQTQTQSQKPKSFGDKIKEEIEKGYVNLEKNMKPTESKNVEEKPIMEKTNSLNKKDRYLTDYDEPYEIYNGKGTLEGKEYKSGRYVTEYDKPYETYDRKNNTLEGKTYKKRDEDFYNRREKDIPIMDKKSGMSMQEQILTGIIYSEILSKPKSKQ